MRKKLQIPVVGINFRHSLSMFDTYIEKIVVIILHTIFFDIKNCTFGERDTQIVVKVSTKFTIHSDNLVKFIIFQKYSNKTLPYFKYKLS